jgi:hypothetical protein
VALARWLSVVSLQTRPSTIGVENPGSGIGQKNIEHRAELRLRLYILDRDHDLDPMIEVARHKVGAPDVGR